MADVRQVPATVNIEFVRGDDWSRLFDFNISLAGYTFDAVTSSGIVIDVAETDLSAGQITLHLSKEKTAQIGTTETWSFSGTVSSKTRTFFAGRMIAQ